MYQPYEDILDKLGSPLWWDENGVPRYTEFHPRMCAGIYAEYAALIEIRCQGCQKTFPVSSVWSIAACVMHPRGLEDIVWDEHGKNGQPKAGLPKQGDAGFCGYGDAPWHGYDQDLLGNDSQCSGTTMTTDIVRVLQFWKRDYKESFDWQRMPEHEVYIGEDCESAAADSMQT